MPEPSERRTTAIGCAASGALGLRVRIVRWFQILISPRKIRASAGPSSVRSPDLTLPTLITGTTPPSKVGNWMSPNWSSSAPLSGMSVAPKVTVLSWICRMPAAEPTGRYSSATPVSCR